MLDSLKKLVAALEQIVDPEQAKPKVKWVINNLIDCEENPKVCPPEDVGACCLPGVGLGGNECAGNIMKDACESQGGTFYPNQSCEEIGNGNCSTGNQVETQDPGGMSVEPTMI